MQHCTCQHCNAINLQDCNTTARNIALCADNCTVLLRCAALHGSAGRCTAAPVHRCTSRRRTRLPRDSAALVHAHADLTQLSGLHACGTSLARCASLARLHERHAVLCAGAKLDEILYGRATPVSTPVGRGAIAPTGSGTDPSDHRACLGVAACAAACAYTARASHSVDH